MTRRCDQCGDERDTRALYRWKIPATDGVRPPLEKIDVYICHRCYEKHGTPARIWCGEISFYRDIPLYPPSKGDSNRLPLRGETEGCK